MLAHGSVGVIVRVAVRETAVHVAVRMALLPATAGGVVTVNVALVAPPAIETLAGTAAEAGALLESATTKPAAGAADDSVTVPVDDVPAFTLAGASATDASVGAVTDSVAVRDRALNVAVITALLFPAGAPGAPPPTPPPPPP